MTYEGADFNEDFIRACTLKEFISQRGFQVLWPSLTDEKRKERLTELYILVHGQSPDYLNLL